MFNSTIMSEKMRIDAADPGVPEYDFTTFL